MMREYATDFVPLEALRPQLLALLALHRAAETEEARQELVAMFERAFLATAWHVAQELLETGWSPTRSTQPARARPLERLRVVGGPGAA